jgi:protein-tyrosine phosphatase
MSQPFFQPVRVLFVCMGNICRSPTAEAVMKKLVSDAGLSDRIYVDSAGTHGYHVGDRSDPRTREAGERRGYVFDHFARKLDRTDFDEFDYILAADEQNLDEIRRITPRGPHRAKVSLLLSHCRSAGCTEVPDPYYGGAHGFERVLDLVEMACADLLAKIRTEHRL